MTTARVRGRHQRKVDEVDVPSPTAWLHHDASAALRLRRDAQNNLQLLDQRSDRSRNPIYEQADDDLVAVIAGASSYRASSVRGAEVDGHGGADTAEGEQKRVAPSRRFSKVHRNKTLRAIIGGEVLPWGAWPVRLRNHDGQDFYGFHGCPPPFVGGSEDIVHDRLGRWGPDEQYRSVAEGHHEGTVKRLFPGTHGGWVEPPPPPPPKSGAARIGGTASIKATTPPRDPGSPTPCGRDEATSKKRLVPSWYGGWREIDDSASTTRTRGRGTQEDERAQKRHRTRSSSWGRQTAFRSAAAESCAVSTPAAAGGGSTPTSSSGANDSSTDDASTAATSRRPLQRRRRRPRSLREQQGGDERGRAGGEGEEEGGGKRKRSAGVEGTSSGGSDSSDCHESGDGCERRCWQGWTVSEPANEAVRRVWGRARRRARDSFEPSHRSSPRRPTRSTACGSVHPGGGEGLDRGAEGSVGDESTIEEEEGGITGGSSPGAGYPADRALRDTLDPVLLSCLGRECEGIIDAALGVVLEDRLRRASSSRVAGQDGTGGHQRPPSPSPPSPPMANWEDVLRIMWSCSSIARTAERDAAAVAGVEVGSGERLSTDGDVGGAAERKGGEEGAAATKGTEAGARERRRVWGAGDSSDGAVVVVNDSLPGLPLNEAVLTRSYNRLLLCLHEKKPWAVERCL